MHVVSDLQQRSNKGRLKCEKRIVPLYDICTLVQLVCMIIHTTNTVIAGRRTFTHSVWARNPLELVPSLRSKTWLCRYDTQRSNLYAFRDVNLLVSGSNADDMFADHATQMCLSVLFAGVALLLGIVNRSAVESNFFSVRWRNFAFHKDSVSATEIVMLCLVLRTSLMMHTASTLLSDYLRYCNVTSNAYMPFCSSAPMFIFFSVGGFTYLAGGLVYLWNALPKYGIMTAAEIDDYKGWLRGRRARLEEARRSVAEARKANLRLQLLIHSDSMPQQREATQPISLATSTRHEGIGQPYQTRRSSLLYNQQEYHHHQQQQQQQQHFTDMPRRRDTPNVRSQHQQQLAESVPPLYASYTGGSQFHSS